MARIVYTDISGQERSVPISAQAPVVSIGRAVDCTIRSNRKSVSRRHAEFRFANGQFEVIDLNSSNGTYLIINDQRRPVMGREYVTHNDEVWCGDFILRFYDEAIDPMQDNDSTLEGGDNVGRAPMATFDSVPPNNGAFGNQPSFGQSSPSGFSDPIQQSHIGGGGGPNQSGFGLQQPSDPVPQPQQQPTWTTPPQQQQLHQSSWVDDAQPSWAEPQPAPPQTPPPNQPQWGNDAGLNDGQSSWSEPAQSQFNPDQGVQTLDDSPSELERVQAEKRSIEDMAARQRSEIERLESLIDTLREGGSEPETGIASPDPTKAVGEHIDEISRELSDSRLENERLLADLEKAVEKSEHVDELEREIDELRALNDTIRAQLNHAKENQRDPDHEATIQASLEEKDGIIIELRSTIQRLETSVNELESNVDRAASSSEQVQSELERLRDEVKRKERLVVEFERRNRELQHDLTVHEEAAGTLQEKVNELNDELGSVDPEALLKAQDARTTAELALELKADEVSDLKSQIASLTEQLGNLSGADRRIAELEAENTQLREALAHGEAVEQTVAEIGPPLIELQAFLVSLERIVDAIDRTDLGPLSTVDRVRLQSAIRETDPKTTLQKFLENL